MKILIADDNPDSRLVLKKMLEGVGHTVESAVHGEEALVKARRAAPDLIISDILMPVMDGYKFCYEVKHDKDLCKVPFVFYTATYTDLEDERLAIGLGASRFVLKPMDPEEFLKIIAEVVGEIEKNKLSVPSEPVDEPLSLFRKFDATLSRKLEEKVRDLELYKRVFDNAEEAIAVCNRDGHIVRQNAGHQRLLGYSDNDLWGRTQAAYFDEAEYEDIRKKIGSRGQARGEARVASKDGKKLYVDYSVFPIKDERGRITSYVWMLRDITLRKEAERRQRLFRTLVDYSNDAIFVIDPLTARLIDVNERACNRLRYDYEELLQMSVPEVDPVFTSDTWVEHIEELKKEGVLLVESRHRRRDGSEFPVEISIVYTEADGSDFMVAVARDITERKLGEERLRVARQEWERTFDAISDIVTLQDRDMRIVRANQATVEAFGLELSQILGKHCYDLFRGKDEPCAGCPIPKAVDAFLPYMAEIEHPSLNRIFQVTAVPVLEDDGTLHGIAHFARDVTDHKKLEVQYMQAQKMEAIGRLSGGIAHDFNNLLTTILGYSELALMHLPEGSSIRDDIAEVHKAGVRAAALTRQLLAFSRKQMLQKRVVNLNEVVENLAKMLKRMIGEDIDLEIRCNAQQHHVYADLGQMEQVLMNLAVNARDAMLSGGKMVISTDNIILDEAFVKEHTDMAAGLHVLMAVSDSGEGMSKEVLRRIFEPFYTTKAQGKGTGLGLATVYGIIKQHNGGITVYSEPGMGTTFKIYLPVSDREKGDEKDAGSHHSFLKGNETLLVVDDEELVRRLICDSIERLGYTIFEADSGEAALELFEREGSRIDLLLTDIVMTGMSGARLAEILIEKKPDLKVILMSGYAEEMVGHREKLKFLYEFVEKPLVPSALSFTLRKVLDGKEEKGA